MSVVKAKPKPRVQKWSRPFWDNCRLGTLTMQKCRDCGNLIFVPKKVCPVCLAEDYEWVNVSGKGKVYAFSCPEKIATPPEFVNDEPFIVAIIDLEEGVRMCSNIVQCAPDQVHIDMQVEVVFERLDDEFTLPKFRPVAPKV